MQALFLEMKVRFAGLSSKSSMVMHKIFGSMLSVMFWLTAADPG
jgi:hypothetical protein